MSLTAFNYLYFFFQTSHRVFIFLNKINEEGFYVSLSTIDLILWLKKITNYNYTINFLLLRNQIAWRKRLNGLRECAIKFGKD